MIYIVDIDGTIADLSHRAHLLKSHEDKSKTSETDWKAFFAGIPDDKPIFEVITVIRALAKAGQTIVYITGRGEENYIETLKWLVKWSLPEGSLYMRKTGDHRQDYLVKSELLDKVIQSIPGVIGGVFEDRTQVVNMYRARGIKVFQVDKGDF